jgi:hypothetical protein
MMINFRQHLEQLKGKRDLVLKELEQSEKLAEDMYLQSIYIEEAQTIIRNVAQLTQQQLEYHIGELVTLAMAGVFDDPYSLGVEFVQRRNRTECDLFFIRNDKQFDPMKASGGGAKNIAAFALRISLWSLAPVRTGNVMILDEPFAGLKGDVANVRVIQMVKTISKKLILQIIMISDERVPMHEIEAGADNIIQIEKRGEFSFVKER